MTNIIIPLRGLFYFFKLFFHLQKIRKLIYIQLIDNIEWGNKYVIYKESLTCIMLPVFER
ncbi:hypothetical protein SEEM965_10129 [Salmonella enterica subsp. enterica serovar Montevideo str. CASC_09SCPH15965]|nr:hypothetical protein SEEM965_10129 [Salmonella enterica subsp. enterica serovar Montevideo str. CASC_09SCPH15965]EFY53543.1 hypothetical protein SEEM19N_14737 [Salmonella enterica subsp. enterica serovar Montevideo str. 19N]